MLMVETMRVSYKIGEILLTGLETFWGEIHETYDVPPKPLPWMINYSPAVGPWGGAKTASGPFPSIAELEQMSVQGTQLDGIWGLLSLGLWKVKLVTFLLKHSDSEGRSEKRVWCLFIQKNERLKNWKTMVTQFYEVFAKSWIFESGGSYLSPNPWKLGHLNKFDVDSWVKWFGLAG